MIEILIEGFLHIVSIVMGWILGMWYAIVRLEKKIMSYIKNFFKRK